MDDHVAPSPAYDLTATHRLPTVSAADALNELSNEGSRFISTGLEDLDKALKGAAGDTVLAPSSAGGFHRGQVIEIWGPPGSGKTAFGIQLAANAVNDEEDVVWVDGLRPVCGTRLRDAMNAGSQSQKLPPEVRMNRLVHFTCPSLAHFIALLCRPTTQCVPMRASLLVIDSVSALVNQAFPKTQEPRNGPTTAPRLQVLQCIISSLQKLAATRNMAVVILSQCATKMQADRNATLIPAINASVWDQGVATRLVLFRDWMFKDHGASDIHSVAIQKAAGKLQRGGAGPSFAFKIQDAQIVPVLYDFNQASFTITASQPKRKIGETDFEVADSQDEDYGWEDEDAGSIPPMPSQWQGSEDIILGQHDDDGNRVDEASEVEVLPEEGPQTSNAEKSPEHPHDERSPGNSNHSIEG